MSDPQDPIYHFDVRGADLSGKVDRANFVVRDVSMITGSLVAKGHDLQVDDTTLKQIFDCAMKLGKVPVKLDHGSGILNVNGHFTNFKRDGDKVRADWYLLASHPATSQMLEICEKQPETVGPSVAFRGDPEKLSGGGKAARCKELVSCDIVPHPAANPGGMFSSQPNAVDRAGQRMPDQPNPQASEESGALDQILQKLEGIEGRISDIEGFLHHATSGDGAEGGEDEALEGGEELGRQFEGLTQLQALDKLVHQFQTKFDQIEQNERTAELQGVFNQLEARQTELIQLAEQQHTEITVLSELNEELRAGGETFQPVRGRNADSVLFAARHADETSFEGMVNGQLTQLAEKHADKEPAQLRGMAVRAVLNTPEGRKAQAASLKKRSGVV